jgi:hypothetical protein
MADNVNIIVQDTINDIVVNAAVVVETIDINVQTNVDVVDIVANPNNYVVNINRIIGEQVQSDWDQNDNQAPDYIKNKPSIPTLTSDLTNDGEDGVNPFITAADVTPQVNSDWDATSGVEEILNKPSIPTLTSDLTNDGSDGINPFITAADVPAAVTSVGLTMPSAFSVANSPITSAGTLEVTGAGLVSQYVRGDGSLANFPTSTGGGSSLTFYLNGSVSQGTFGGVAFKEMDRTPILGAGTDFTISSNGYIQSFITDAGVPNLLEIPAGNWNFETYFSASSNGGSPSFYLELYKWDGTTLSLIASNSANPEGITNGTATHLYLSALPIPQTTLALTDRLAVRIYVTHSGRTITLHTENSHLCQVITTFSTGLTALNGLTAQVQSFATGTSGTDFDISSTTATHTFNLPTASAANRGALSSTDWSTFNGKQAALVSGTNIKTINGNSVLGSGDLVVGGSTSLAIGTTPITSGTIGRILFQGTGNVLQQSANLFWDNTNNRLGIGTATPTQALDILGTNVVVSKIRSSTNTGATIFQGFNDLNNSCEYGIIGSTRAGTGALASGNAYLYGGVDLAVTSLTNIKFGVGSILNERMRIFGATGNIVIQSGGTITDAGFRLDVNGTARVQNVLTVNKGAGNFFTLDAAANGSNLELRFFKFGSFSASLSTREFTTVGGRSIGQGIGLNGGFLATTIGANAGIIAVSNTGGNAEMHIGSPAGFSSYVSFRENGVADRGVIGYQNGTSYFQIRVNGATSMTTGTMSTAFFSSGSVGINTTTEIASSQLTIESTTKGFLPPRMTTTQKNAIATPAAGLMVYDTTLNLISVYNGTMWISL